MEKSRRFCQSLPLIYSLEKLSIERSKLLRIRAYIEFHGNYLFLRYFSKVNKAYVFSKKGAVGRQGLILLK